MIKILNIKDAYFILYRNPVNFIDFMAVRFLSAKIYRLLHQNKEKNTGKAHFLYFIESIFL